MLSVRVDLQAPGTNLHGHRLGGQPLGPDPEEPAGIASLLPLHFTTLSSIVSLITLPVKGSLCFPFSQPPLVTGLNGKAQAWKGA